MHYYASSVKSVGIGSFSVACEVLLEWSSQKLITSPGGLFRSCLYLLVILVLFSFSSYHWVLLPWPCCCQMPVFYFCCLFALLPYPFQVFNFNFVWFLYVYYPFLNLVDSLSCSVRDNGIIYLDLKKIRIFKGKHLVM